MIDAKKLSLTLSPEWNVIGPQSLERRARIVSTCGCGISRTLKQFRTLRFIGHQDINDGQEPSRLEMRNCTCGSTRSIGFDRNGNYLDNTEQTGDDE